MIKTEVVADDMLVQAVTQGLEKNPKALPSWLFYDEEGDRIFQKITRMPAYYLTRCEYEIFQQYKEDIFFRLFNNRRHFQWVELGAGEALKTEVLLKYFYEKGAEFIYRPVDISANVLDQLMKRLRTSLPELAVQPIHKDYAAALDDLGNGLPKVLFFLGANIGNFPVQQGMKFLQNIARHFIDEDCAIIGFDLKKDPQIIINAYSDKEGITREFNLNILKRLNRTLQAHFDLSQFDHYAFYDAESGAAKSFLISLKDQEVAIDAIGRTYHFAQWETIHTEISQKYDLAMMEKLLSRAGFEIQCLYFDSKHYFCDALVKKHDRAFSTT